MNGLFDETVLKRRIYDDLTHPKEGNVNFMKIVSRHFSSLKVKVVNVKIPDDYVVVDIYDNGELGQIAIMEGLLVFFTEEKRGDNLIKSFYVIDHEKRIVYTNKSAVMT